MAQHEEEDGEQRANGEGEKNRSKEKEREGETGDGSDDDGQWLCIPVKPFSASPASVTGKPQPFEFRSSRRGDQISRICYLFSPVLIDLSPRTRETSRLLFRLRSNFFKIGPIRSGITRAVRTNVRQIQSEQSSAVTQNDDVNEKQ